jgi:hypothetical protein
VAEAAGERSLPLLAAAKLHFILATCFQIWSFLFWKLGVPPVFIPFW